MKKVITWTAAMAMVAGCDQVLQNFVDLAVNSPRFVYGVQTGALGNVTTELHMGTIAQNDLGVPMRSPMSSLPSGSLDALEMSPDAERVAVRFTEQTTVTEKIIQLINVETDTIERSMTDNTVLGEVEANCTTSPSLVQALATWDDEIAAGNAPPNSTLELEFFASPSVNEVNFIGWVDATTVRIDGLYWIGHVIVEENGNRTSMGGFVAENFEFEMEFFGGNWGISRCGGILPAVLGLPSERDLSLNATGQILLDGNVLMMAASSTTTVPFATGVSVLSAAITPR